MQIKIFPCSNCNGYHLECNDITVMTSSSEGVIKRNARILTEARNRPRREGLRHIMDQIGYEEVTAVWMLDTMDGQEPPRMLQ